jgi:hypothetical protein
MDSLLLNHLRKHQNLPLSNLFSYGNYALQSNLYLDYYFKSRKESWILKGQKRRLLLLSLLN